MEQNDDVSWALFKGANYFLKGLEQKYKSTVMISNFQAENDSLFYNLHSCTSFFRKVQRTVQETPLKLCCGNTSPWSSKFYIFSSYLHSAGINDKT
jgi:hypothetical protein